MYMNCQQICKNLTEMKIFQKVLGDYFFETPCTCRVTDSHYGQK